MESRVNKYFFIDYFTAAAVRLSPGTFLYQERSPVIQKKLDCSCFFSCLPCIQNLSQYLTDLR